MTAYDRAVDKHLDHTEENPSQNCYFCRRNDWIDEDKEKESEGRSDWMQKMIDKRIQRLEELEQAFDEHTLYDGGLRKKKKEYNKILSFLEEQGFDHDRKRRIIDGDEASGYGKKVNY